MMFDKDMCVVNRCNDPRHHEEVPFCTKHWRSLPKPHCKKMWEQRPAANKGEFGPDWTTLLHLGVAICLVREGWRGEYSDLYIDDDGFDWGLGLQNPERLYGQAVKVCQRFPVR